MGCRPPVVHWACANNGGSETRHSTTCPAVQRARVGAMADGVEAMNVLSDFGHPFQLRLSRQNLKMPRFVTPFKI